MYPVEPSLLQRDKETNKMSMLTDASSSIMTDDYSECDLSLRSYRSSNPGIDETFGLSQQGAKEMLRERLCACALSSGDLHVANDGNCTFVAGGDDHTIDISIRDDAKAMVISTVVQKGKHDYKIQRQSGASYSLMTKMMKHNALLSQAATGRGKPDACHVCVYSGTFILFSNIRISVLTSNLKLELVLDDFIMKAAQIRADFANTRRSQRRGSSQPMANTRGANTA